MGDDFDLGTALPAAATTKLCAPGPLKRDLVAGLEKGMAVIEAFDQERPRLTVRPALLELAHTLKEASAASVLDDADAICIAATSAGRNLSATLQPGIRVPAYCTANGRVLVAALPPEQAEACLARQTLRAMTPHTLIRPKRLRAELQRAREQGYATVDQEVELGMRTVSVPLTNWRGDTVAAINLTVHASRMSIDDLVATGLPALRQAQARLRQLL